MKMNELYFIVLTFGRISKCNDYFELEYYTKTKSNQFVDENTKSKRLIIFNIVK